MVKKATLYSTLVTLLFTTSALSFDEKQFYVFKKTFRCIKWDLSGVKLPGASLSYIALTSLNLSNADLSGANLTETDLPGTMLNANFSGADLSGANLQKADIKGAPRARWPLHGRHPDR